MAALAVRCSFLLKSQSGSHPGSRFPFVLLVGARRDYPHINTRYHAAPNLIERMDADKDKIPTTEDTEGESRNTEEIQGLEPPALKLFPAEQRFS